MNRWRGSSYLHPEKITKKMLLVQDLPAEIKISVL